MYLEAPEDLFRELVQFMYNAECQLVITLPRVAGRAQSDQLRSLIEQHHAETIAHADRLAEVAASLGFDCGGKVCLAMQGLLKEGDELSGYGGPPEIVDRIIIGASRRVEHFEIAAYTDLLELAREFAAGDAVQLLQQTLREEQAADEKLARHGQIAPEVQVPAGARIGARHA